MRSLIIDIAGPTGHCEIASSVGLWVVSSQRKIGSGLRKSSCSNKEPENGQPTNPNSLTTQWFKASVIGDWDIQGNLCKIYELSRIGLPLTNCDLKLWGGLPHAPAFSTYRHQERGTIRKIYVFHNAVVQTDANRFQGHPDWKDTDFEGLQGIVLAV